MPYKDREMRRRVRRESDRRRRLYPAAVAAGNPKALEAERQRALSENAMRPSQTLYAEIAALPDREARQQRKAEYIAFNARCLDERDAAREAYARLRAEVIADAEFAALL